MKKSVEELKKMTVEERNKYIKKLRDRDSQKVKGVFRFYEVPNGNLTFFYKIYPQEPVEKYSLDDGKMYELPLGVARHLNTSGKYPVHAHKMGENDKPSIYVNKLISRYAFQSLDFMDLNQLDDAGESILAVPDKVR